MIVWVRMSSLYLLEFYICCLPRLFSLSCLAFFRSQSSFFSSFEQLFGKVTFWDVSSRAITFYFPSHFSSFVLVSEALPGIKKLRRWREFRLSSKKKSSHLSARKKQNLALYLTFLSDYTLQSSELQLESDVFTQRRNCRGRISSTGKDFEYDGRKEREELAK